MGVLKQFLDFYINSSIHVALAVFSLTYITLLELDLEYNEPVLYFVFYASITGYNFVKYFGIAKFHHRQLARWLRLIQILSFVCFIAMCYYALQLQIRTLIYLVVFGIITFLYAIPFLSKNKLSLRSIRGIKVYVIALVWTGVTIFIPIINENEPLDKDTLIMAFQRFIFVLVLMIPFEIRDLKFDDNSLNTIPQKLGINRTKLLGVILLTVFYLLQFLSVNIGQNESWIMVTLTMITALLVIAARENQSKYYASFLVESIPIVWLILMLM